MCRYGTSSNHDRADAMCMRNRMAMSGLVSASCLHQAHLTRQRALNQGGLVVGVRGDEGRQKAKTSSKECLPSHRGNPPTSAGAAPKYVEIGRRGCGRKSSQNDSRNGVRRGQFGQSFCHLLVI